MVKPGTLQQGASLPVRAHKADGECYRWWTATVEQVGEGWIATTTPVGHQVKSPKGVWESPFAIRSYYWFDRPYSLLEVFKKDGSLQEIYIHVSSHPRLENGALRYTDYELDVVYKPGRRVEIVDQDEFEEAARRYGYSVEFQRACYGAAKRLREVARTWTPGTMPV